MVPNLPKQYVGRPRFSMKSLFVATTVISLFLAGLVWTATNVQRGVGAAYYEWGVTCIIVSYAEEHGGSPPRNWNDLVGYEYHCKYFPVHGTMDEAAANVCVDFDALRAFAGGNIPELPVSVVKPTRGFEMHWIYPKGTLEAYFRDGERPQGSLTAEEAAQLRSIAEWDE